MVIKTKKENLIGYIFGKFQWLSEKQINLSNIIIATLGLSVPVAIGLAFGRIQLGIIASLGGLTLCHEEVCDTLREQISRLVYALIASISAFILGSFLSGNGAIPLIFIPIIILIISIIGKINRPMLRASILFITFFMIATSFEISGRRQFFVILFYSFGALWTAILTIIIRPLSLKFNKYFNLHDSNKKQPDRKYSFEQLFVHWKKSLYNFDSWQYTFRITLCVIIAEIIKYLWPNHRGYWILLTVAIVVRHRIDKLLPRMFKRAAGTFIGVIVSIVFVYYMTPQYMIVLIIGVLAAVRSILRENNYLAYSAVMTPLVVILLDFGNLSSFGIILDRLLATLFGCGISFVFGYFIWIKLLKSEINLKKDKPVVNL